LPAPVNGGEIIVDDTNDNTAGFRKGSGGYGNSPCTGACGNWSAATIGYGNDMYHTPADRSTNSADQWAEWTPSGIQSEGGVYEVFIYIPSANATSWQAPYVIRHLNANGAWVNSLAVVDQFGLYNQWVSIGTYRMKPGALVWTHDASGETFSQHCAGSWCKLGVDAVKFVRRGVTSAPDARFANNNWGSTVWIRNNGGGPADLIVKFLKGDGSVACATATSTLAAHSLSIPHFCETTQWATTVVDSSQDVSVVVLQERSSPYTLEAYPGVSNPTAEVRIAIVQRNNSGFYSELFIQNAGAATTNISGEFLPAPGCGSPATFYWNNIVANSRYLVNTGALSIGNGSGVFIGSVRITNSQNQPLAVASTQYKDSGGVSQLFETSNTETPATTLYAPLIQNNNNGFSSGLVLSRSGDGAFDVRYYHNSAGNECSSQTDLTNNPQVIYPAPPAPNNCPTVVLGKFQFSSQTQSPMTANINQLKTGGLASTYAAIASPAKTAIVARLRRTDNWNDGFVVANFNAATALVTVQLYNIDGTLHSTPISNDSLGANRSLTVLGQIPSGFLGSAVVTASEPVVVTVNALAPGSGDVIGSYPASHR
jgi:hypothetical protein